MRKEIFYAIFAGGILGLIIAFGVWRTNIALKPTSVNQNSNDKIVTSPTPGSGTNNADSGITIASPSNDDVVTENPVRISGITKANTFVTISAPEQDYILKSEKDGSFQSDIELSGGLNQILVTSFDDDGTMHTESLSLVFSTEFK